MSTPAPALLTFAALLLALLGGCGGPNEHSGKSSTDANKPTETLPKPPKPDPG
jgi:hypothetical protein